MRVEFGTTLQMGTRSQEPDRFGDLCQFLDDSGFSTIWMGDEQSLRREVYVSMALAAASTSRIQLNVGPTNPLTRHPTVTAGAISTLDEVSRGRVALTVSVGYTNVANAGLKPARMADVESYVAVLRSLWRDHQATWNGNTIRLVWPEGDVPPIYLIAEGPKTMRLAGRIADGVIVGLGHTPEVIEATMQYLDEGAISAGRRVDELDVWWHTRWNIGESYEAAVAELRGRLASAAGHALSRSFDGKLVPDQYQATVRRIQRSYDFAQHGSAAASHTQLMDEAPGLQEYLAQRFAIAGTLSQFIGRLEELASLGVTQLRLGPGPLDRGTQLRILAEEVIPRFRG